MTLTLMMFPSEMMWLRLMLLRKHRIIANEMSNIIFARQMHNIAIGHASLKIYCIYLVWVLIYTKNTHSFECVFSAMG